MHRESEAAATAATAPTTLTPTADDPDLFSKPLGTERLGVEVPEMELTVFPPYMGREPAGCVRLTSLRDLAEKWGLGEAGADGPRPPKMRDKRAIPLFARGRCPEARQKLNIRPPMLTCLDVDGAAMSLEEASGRLELYGVSHVGYTTHSHGAEPGRHSYRIFPDLVAHCWQEAEAISRALFAILGLKPTRESWQSGFFFLPATHPAKERRAAYRSVAVVDEPSSIDLELPPLLEGEGDSAGAARAARDLGTADRQRDEPLDVDLVRSALETIPNAERDDWIRVGMALHREEAIGGLEEGQGRELWDEWSDSQDYPDFSHRAQDQAWGSFRSGGGGRPVGAGTIYRMAREAGWRPVVAALSPEALQAAQDGARRAFAEVINEDDPAETGKAADSVAKTLLDAARLDPNLTEAGFADVVLRQHGHELIYVHSFGSWSTFDGRRWCMDHGKGARERAKVIARAISEVASTIEGNAGRAWRAWAKSCLSTRGITGALGYAETDPRVARSVAELDADLMLVNVANGTLDLRTYELRPHDPADLITRVAPVDYIPGFRCLVWEAALERSLPDPDVRACFQRLCGYTLQGGQEAKVIALLFGDPDDGKSTAMRAIMNTLGSSKAPKEGKDVCRDAPDDGGAISRTYASTTDVSTFASGRDGSGNTPALAYLVKVRLVAIFEVLGKHTIESGVAKRWSGGDKIAATPKYGHPFEYDPDGTLVMVGNELPEFEFEDDATWNRLLVIPFGETIPEAERDPKLLSKIDPRGVLAWLVEGHREYARIGLAPPEACRRHKRAHRAKMDPLGAFFEERLAVTGLKEHRVSKAALRVAYDTWYRADSGERPQDKLGRNALTRAVNARIGTGAGGNFREADTTVDGKSFKGWEGMLLDRRRGERRVEAAKVETDRREGKCRSRENPGGCDRVEDLLS